MRKCLPLFREFVKVHLIYPLTSDSLPVKLPNIDPHNLSCLTLSHQLNALKKHKDEFKLYGESEGVQYPVNLLRNVARKNAETNYILVLDIDLIPSRSLRKDFLQFIKQNKKTAKLPDNTVINLNDQIVFVLPTFEMDVNIGNNLANVYPDDEENDVKKNDKNSDRKEKHDNDPMNDPMDELMNDDFNDEFDDNEFKKSKHLGMNLGNIVGKNFGTYTIPTNISILLPLIKKKLVRPFYFELCYKCQKSTDYEQWQTVAYESHLNVIYEITWQDPYEPFYIAMNTDSLPYYDERFKQYVFQCSCLFRQIS